MMAMPYVLKTSNGSKYFPMTVCKVDSDATATTAFLARPSGTRSMSRMLVRARELNLAKTPSSQLKNWAGITMEELILPTRPRGFVL